MKKNLILLICSLFLINCSSKKPSDTFLMSERYFENYIKYYFQGNFTLAETNFLKAVDLFQKSDDQCNLSKLYISKNLIQNDNNSLEYAKRYALLGHCDEEINTIDFLSGKPYIYDKLPSSLKIQAQEFKSAEELIKILSKDDFSDWTRSRLYRDFAQRFISRSDTNNSDILIEYALKIDRFNGWTYNIQKDLLLKKEICLLKHDDCKYIDERLDIINRKMIKK